MKDLKNLKKAELQSLANDLSVSYDSSTTVKQLIDSIEATRNGNAETEIPESYQVHAVPSPRPETKFAKDYPESRGELCIDSTYPWTGEKAPADGKDSIVIFYVGRDKKSKQRLMTFGGVIKAAGNKADIDPFMQVNGKVYIKPGLQVQIAPNKFEFIS